MHQLKTLAHLMRVTNEMDEDAQLRNAAACPNVMLDFAQFNGGFTETAIALGCAVSSWDMDYSDEDSDVFARVGLSCQNLQKISVMTSCTAFSEPSFRAFFLSTNPTLRRMSVEFRSASDFSVVLNVLAEKVDSLTSLACNGYSVSVEILQVFLASQKNLVDIDFFCEGFCNCKELRYRPHAAPNDHENDMGLNWRPIVNSCINHSGLERIECLCNNAGDSP